MSTDRIVALLIVLVGVAVALYMLIDDTPLGWMVRLSWAGAITAGVAAVLIALERLTRRP